MHYYTTPVGEPDNRRKMPFFLILVSVIMILGIAGLASGIYILTFRL